MPIFHDNVEGDSLSDEADRSWDVGTPFSRHIYQHPKESGESSPPDSKDFAMTINDGRPLSRDELIQRIKRGESPTWTVRHGNKRPSPEATSPKTSPRECPTPLLPSVELRGPPIAQEALQDINAAGLEIERPRSALHSGDFGPEKSTAVPQEPITSTPLVTTPEAPWHHAFPPYFPGPRSFDDRPPSRSRAISQSFSNILLMPPTSPLVQAVNNPDLDFSPRYLPSRRKTPSPERENRRHTFSPQSFQNFQTQCFGSSTSPRPPSSLRREGPYPPYQAHQPRRSITSASQLQPNSTPQTPLSRPRRTSTSSEISPLVHATMVGSYEESILRGRMSTTPSKPLNFIAQIGVLGKGKCKASLRCPPHATVPFPAVFYSYSSGNGRILENQPSPYVGLIDIENSLPHPEAAEDDSKRRRRYASPAPVSDRGGDDLTTPQGSGAEDVHARQLRQKKDRLRKRSRSPRAPPGGSYRIPQQGQLQIVIKNPNKTAVKLFLVPYDFSDMEPGTKTFIRQRSYSAGPIIDMPLASRTNLGTDRPEASLSNSEDPSDRPTLRYLIHINICCTGKGRYYLYKSIRVVFANRVPDGKEKLRNEIQLPDPRYSAYKPIRDSNASTTPTSRLSLGATLSSEMAAKRRSIPYNPYVHMQHNIFATHHPEAVDGLASSSHPASPAPANWPHLNRSHVRAAGAHAPPPPPLPPLLPLRDADDDDAAPRSPSLQPLRPIPFTLSSRAASLGAAPRAADGAAEEDCGDGRAARPFFAKTVPPMARKAEERGDGGAGWLKSAADGGSGRESPSLLARKLRGE